MALHSLRLRRAISLSSSVIHHALLQQKPLSSIPPLSHLLPTSYAPSSTNAFSQVSRSFTSTTSLLMSPRGKVFDPETDEIGPDTILFEGCDYNHWLITVDFPKEPAPTREQMIETYVNIAAQVFGSVEEAKQKIYALSTTVYQGFQVLCSEETSEKFKNIPGVVFVLPDSYIDPVNKEYGGDKYENGVITPRPPPVQYGRQYKNRRPRGQPDYGSPPQQNYQPRQNYSPPPQQQKYPPPPQQPFSSPPQQQNYARSPQQQSYQSPPQHQNYPPQPMQQNFRPPPQQQQNYPPPPQQPNFPGPPHLSNYPPPPQQQSYAPPPQQRNYPSSQPENHEVPPHRNHEQQPWQSYEQPPQQNYRQPPNFNRGEPRNYSYTQQGNVEGHVHPEQRGYSREPNYGSPQDGNFGQGWQRNFSTMGKE